MFISMGGAVVVHASHSGKISNVLGTVVIDVVEGTALEALSSMNFFLSSRPSTFKTENEAVEWALSHNQLRNRDSANISIPSQLCKDGTVYKWRTNLKNTSQFCNSFKFDLKGRVGSLDYPLNFLK